MAASSVQTPPQPTVGPGLPNPSRPQTSSWPRATLPPALLAGAAATETPPPPLRLNEPAATVAGQGRNKRRPPLPPSVNGAKKPRPAAQPHTPPPPSSFISSVVVATATTTAERRLALDKKVAGCLLSRSWAGAWRHQAEGRAALRCVCFELPPGSRCALHQDAPERSWMEQQNGGGVPPVGGDGEVHVHTVGAGRNDAEVFAEYARWRRNVRMPSRFYVQHIRAIDPERRMGDGTPPARAI